MHIQGAKFGGKKDKFGGKSFKKLNSAEFMEFVISKSDPMDNAISMADDYYAFIQPICRPRLELKPSKNVHISCKVNSVSKHETETEI